MAVVNLASITSVLEVRFQQKIVSNINRATPVLQLIEIEDGDGQNIQWDTEFGVASAGGATAGGLAEGADVTVFSTDTKAAAVLQFGTYYESFQISGKAIAAAYAARNPTAMAALFERELLKASQRLAKVIAEDVYVGDGSASRMTGLLGGAILSTGSYATLSRTTYPQWASILAGNSGTPRALTTDLMRYISRKVLVAGAVRPNLILCGPATHEQYGLTFGTNRRYVEQIQGPGGPIKLDGGYKVLEFDGVPVVEDINCPEGEMLFINTDTVKIKQLPQPGVAIGATGALGDRTLMGQDLANGTNAPAPTRLRARIQPLAVTGDLFKFALFIYPQLQVEQPNTCGVLADLTYVA